MVNNKAFGITLLVIVTIIIIILIIWSVQKNNRAKRENKEAVWPPTNYMREIGSKCPDYWVHIGNTENGETICQNKFNIPVQKDQCYNNNIPGFKDQDNLQSFNKISKWPIPNDKVQSELGSYSSSDYKYPCAWIKNCGPDPKTKASWIGLSDLCV